MKLLKLIAIALITLPFIATAFLNTASATAVPVAQDFDAAGVYKAKCAMCHGQKAEKKFDAAKADDDLVNTILKSDRPGMPAYETKGIDAEQAKALVTHMKSLKQ
ncbi:MAG TPA: cytochrome c [Pyrinomonadaceae bacterium]|jgi:mono/diheme cytochrome c family protein|nr:cytochrome c [Pyrinomonadaceae bacterium]